MMLKMRSYAAHMQRDGLITFIMIETICVPPLAYFCIGTIFSFDTGISPDEAIAALTVASGALPVFGLFWTVTNFFRHRGRE